MEPPPSTVAPRPRTWERAWQEALYGPAGFYRSSSPGGHFATSAQGIPGGGELLARALVALAGRHGCTQVVDVGAGGGELLAAVAALAPDLTLTGVDVVDRRGARSVDGWLLAPGGAVLPQGLVGLEDALVVGHEWLDVVPCPVVARGRDRVWREVAVLPDGTETEGPPVGGEHLAWLERWVGQDVERAEVGLPRDRAAADLLGRISSGVLLLVDYGHVRGDRPRHGTLTGFRSGREVAPVPDGTCDLTAHVAVDSLTDHLALTRPRARPRVLTQRAALADLLPGAGVPVPHGLARSAPTAYLRALASRAALRTLTAPGGLGDFAWVTVQVPREPGGRQ